LEFDRRSEQGKLIAALAEFEPDLLHERVDRASRLLASVASCSAGDPALKSSVSGLRTKTAIGRFLIS
jgi:hypothetical protein